MSESSDNPESEQKPEGASKPGDPVPPAPRVKPGPAEPAPGSQISMQDLMALARTLSASGVQLENPEAAAARGTISREQRKFSKAGRGEVAEGEARAENVEPDLEAGVGRDALLKQMTPRTRRSRSSSSRGPGLIVPAAIILTLGALILGVWFLAKAARLAPEKPAAAHPGPTPAESRAPATSLTRRAAELTDKIAEAAAAGDATKALALCVVARSEGQEIYGLSYREGLYATQTGDYPGAAVAANRSLDRNEEVSASYMLRAAIMARGNRPQAVLHEYESAAAAAPFDPKPFFFWGESLRRFGRPQAALVRLEEAIARATDPDMADFYRFKERLTYVEMDRAAEFADELKTKLALPAPGPDWFLTAAAVELKKGNYPAATTFLEKASAGLTPGELESRLRDYFFFGFAREPALAKFYAPLLKPAPVAAASSSSPGAAATSLAPPETARAPADSPAPSSLDPTSSPAVPPPPAPIPR